MSHNFPGIIWALLYIHSAQLYKRVDPWEPQSVHTWCHTGSIFRPTAKYM
jgi:hypothetical protein